MNMSSQQKLESHLKAGRVYRREALLAFSNAVDRDLMALTHRGVLEKVGAGLYYKPTQSRFGVLPPDDKELVRSFLRDDFFLVYSWNEYNSLSLGLTQLYNRFVVYNRKRHGVFELGERSFDFRRPARGFPSELTPEFLLVDLVNNLGDLVEDVDFVKGQVKKNVHRFDSQKLHWAIKRFGKIATKRFFEEIKD